MLTYVFSWNIISAEIKRYFISETLSYVYFIETVPIINYMYILLHFF